jgi:hypothetical protein
MTHFDAPFGLRQRLAALLSAVAALTLAGCVDTAVDLGARQAGVPQPRLVARPGVSPHGASVALTSLEGAPEGVASRFKQHFASASEARDIAMAAPDAARYRVRGYLTASPGPGVTRLSYVWDIFDRHGRRAQRLTDELAVRGGGDWSDLDDKALADVAGRGAEDLAAFLSNTPEAIAAAGGEGAGLSVVAGQRAPPSSPVVAPPAGVAEAR